MSTSVLVSDQGDPKPQSETQLGPKKFETLVGQRYREDVSKYVVQARRIVGTIKEEWCDDVLAAQGFELDDTYARSNFEPDKMFEALSGYDGVGTWRFDDDKAWSCLQRAVNKVSSIFADHFGSLDPLPLNEDLWSVVKHETSAGLPTLAPKKMVFNDELHRAERLLESERLDRVQGRKRTGPKEVPEPCVAYHRTQASIDEDGNPKKKVRLVWGYPLSMILIEGMYARPVIDLTLKAVTPIALGYRKAQLGAIMASTQWWPVSGTFDWSKWDANIPNRLIMEGFRIVKKFFRSVDEDAWNLITRYFSTCGILMGDGFVYKRRRKGIPSGSFFTSIVGSICNMIAIYFLAFMQGLDIVGLHVLGDDSFAGLTGNISVNTMVDHSRYYFGMKLNLDKLVYGGTKSIPRFLGHDWNKGRITRPLIETVQRIQYPERYNRYWWEQRYDKLISLYGDNVDAWPLIHEILKSKRFASGLGSGEQFLLKHFRDFSGFTETESPEVRGERKRFAAATFK